MRKWEYWRTSFCDIRRPGESPNTALDRVGADGWELVSVVCSTWYAGAIEEVCYFKRPVADEPVVPEGLGGDRACP